MLPKYRLLGYPLTYSLSPYIHQLFAKQCNIKLDYKIEPILTRNLPEFWSKFWLTGGKGLNITTPYKVLTCEYINELKSNAKIAKAINTVGISANGTIWGDNTDGAGFFYDLMQYGISLTGLDVLILGAGGAVRGIMQKIIEAKPSSVTIINRDLHKAECIANDFYSVNIKIKKYREVAKIKAGFIINALSVGTNFFELLDLHKLNFNKAIYYDLNYTQNITSVHEYAMLQGAVKTFNGLGMLVAQAAMAFCLWHEYMPKIEPVLAQIKQINKIDKHGL